MILSDKTIKEKISSKEIVVNPLTDNSIQPASVDVRLSNYFLAPQFRTAIVEMNEPISYSGYSVNDKDGYVLSPHDFVLASTAEYIKIPDNITGWIEGRSSIGRMGLFIQNAGWIDPGFEGTITLELFNASNFPIRLIPGRRIGQIIFAELDKPCENPYNGKYQGQQITTGSRIYEDLDYDTNKVKDQ